MAQNCPAGWKQRILQVRQHLQNKRLVSAWKNNFDSAFRFLAGPAFSVCQKNLTRKKLRVQTYISQLEMNRIANYKVPTIVMQ